MLKAVQNIEGASNSVIATQNALSIGRGFTINSVGDSLSAVSSYAPSPFPSYAIAPPQWLANHAYVANNTCVNNGLYYRCTTGGTSAASGGPTGVTTAITDNTVTWRYMPPQSQKSPREMLFWIEAWSLGELQWNQSDGYGGSLHGITKIIVKSGGTGYANTDTITFTNGALGSLIVAAGVITGVLVTDPGYNPSGTITASISTSTGSGAALTIIQNAAGTFGETGNNTSDIVASLPDIVASNVDIFTVLVGINDITGGTSYATIVANLKIIYETLVNAGRKVIVIPIFPVDTSLVTAAQNLTLQRVNRWIRAYYRKESWANPLRTNVLIADNTRYMTNGSTGTGTTSVSPIGGITSAVNSMTVDGKHQSERGAQYLALAVINSLATIMGTLSTTTYRIAGMSDGYDPTNNPGGNVLEGAPWVASATSQLGQHVVNDTAPVKVYACTTAGTNAGSGGPTGTGSAITDGTTVWKYLYSQGQSVFAPTYDVTPTAATGIVYTGNIPHNCKLSRANGTAVGTVITTRENPWSDGQIGQRMVMAFSLGSGTNAELWEFTVNLFGSANYGIEASALGNSFFYAEAEVEITTIANVISVGFGYTDNVSNSGTFQTEAGREFAQGSGANYNMMNSSGEMLSYPNNGKMYLRSEPMIIPTNNTNPQIIFPLAFNASGAANSSTLTIKFNWMALRKDFTA